jgi:hypothetical protein
VYWVFIILGFLAMRYSEVYGHWPLMKPKKREASSPHSGSSHGVGVGSEKKVGVETVKSANTIEV